MDRGAWWATVCGGGLESDRMVPPKHTSTKGLMKFTASTEMGV